MNRKKLWQRMGMMLGVAGLCAFGILEGMIWKKKTMYLWTEEKNQFTSSLFGENTYIFTPQDDPALVNEILEGLWETQETDQFGTNRYSIYFIPGEYDASIAVKVGFYMQVAGLGLLPTETSIPSLTCDARWLGEDETNHNACCNFWRGVENLEIGSNTLWAVSQATFIGRVQVDGALYLHDDYGWASGGFLADSVATRMVDSGSQQQWLSRNNSFPAWLGDNWNLLFVGDAKGSDPTGTWPVKSYTSVEETPIIREKPFLFYDEKEGFMVFVPDVRTDASGVSWQGEDVEETGKKLSLDTFYIARPETDTAKTLNKVLRAGKNILFTPGIYQLEEALAVGRADTILLGMGLATLTPVNGNACVETKDVGGIILAGLLFDAGEEESTSLLVVGDAKSEASHEDNPITLSDLFFRVGGTETSEPARTENCLVINSSHVIGDNFWVWRDDHGTNVGWEDNTAINGLIVEGDNVTIYGLMVEHFQEYQTIWRGENGRVYMYQSEIPYDVPSQEEWMSHDGAQNGFASFLVTEEVKQFEAVGLGIYLYNRDAAVELYSAMEVPDEPGVSIFHICTVMLNGYPGIRHVINDEGQGVFSAVERAILLEYRDGIFKE